MRRWLRGPIQHKSAVLRDRDHGLRVPYYAGTARTKRALTNLLYFGRAQVEWSCRFLRKSDVIAMILSWDDYT